MTHQFTVEGMTCGSPDIRCLSGGTEGAECGLETKLAIGKIRRLLAGL